MVHSYKQLEGTPLWHTVENTIAALVRNGDIVEQTPRNYIVGYLCSELEQHVPSHNQSQE